MKRNVTVLSFIILVIVAVPLMILISQNPLFSHADTATGCTTTTQPQQDVVKLPFNGFPNGDTADNNSATNDWATAWGVDTSDGKNWGWDNMSTTCDPAVSSDSVLKVHYAAHSSAPSCNCADGGGQFYAFFQDANLVKNSNLMASSGSPLYFQYYVKFPQDFDFGKAGKLPGLFGGSDDGVSGGNHNTDAWSTRLMWRGSATSQSSSSPAAKGEIYFYDPNQGSGYGADLGLGSWAFQGDDQWHPVEQEIQNTDQGSTVTIWYDGKKVFTDQINTSGIPPAGIFFSTFFGGHDPSWGPDQDEDMYYADFELSTQYIPPDAMTNNNVTPAANSAFTPVVNLASAPTCSSSDQCAQATIEGYSYADNDDGGDVHSNTAAIAYAKSYGYPTLHEQATEGSGMYDDPITFAAYTPLTTGDSSVFAPGTRIYVPYLRKFFIMEDSCDDCNQGTNGSQYLLHFWVGPSSLTSQDDAQSLKDCEAKIEQQTTQIVINPPTSKNYPVEQTPLYSNGTCTAKTFPTQSSSGTPTDVPAMTPTATSSDQSGPSSDGKTVTVSVTSYGFPDNDDGSGHYNTSIIAYPKSDGNPTLHDEATEGSGTYDDPITFAAAIPYTEGNDAVFAPGTRIYVPYLQKYFILEDQCADCDDATGDAAYHIDLYMGPSTDSGFDEQSLLDCEDSITHDSEQIIINPVSNHPVDQTPLYSNGQCTAKEHSS